MYKITYIHRGETKENPLYTPGDQDYCLTDAQLALEMGKAGELNISIPYTNPARQDIECLTDEVIFYRDDVEIWRGRPVTIQIDFDLTGKLTCEGILAYLYDTYYEPFEFEGSPNDLFKSIINNHNSHVESIKQFTVGDITVSDPNDYINRSSIYYDRSLNVLTEKLINDSLGGYFRVRVEGNTRYIDYLAGYDTRATQTVEYGENILDIAEEVEYSDVATVILPLGAKIEDADGSQTDEYTTIASVNGGSIYYEDAGAVAGYGWICVSAEWEDVTVPANLLEKAKVYLEQVTSAVSSFTINAVDLSRISGDYEPINLGDYVYIRSLKHNINQYVELSAMTIYPLAPENDVLQFGADSASITGSERNTQRAVQAALGSLSMRVTNLSTVTLSAIYGDIEFLTANVANIETLLGATAGFGTLESIHLTAENVVIDEAVIVNALAENATIGNLIAGKIFTDFIEIMDNEEDQSLYITGSVIQFKDADGVVRMQIGLDASGYWNYYILDADGNAIFDALGLTEAGLTGNGAIIRDVAVADDANIAGYKIDMETLTECINEYGGLVMDASQVIIDGNTLDYELTRITQEIDGLSFEGLKDWKLYFAKNTSDTIPPEDDYYYGAICNIAICGMAICGLVEGSGIWSLEEPTADITSDGYIEYIWAKYWMERVDGTVEWSEPFLWSDSSLRRYTSTLQTELTVVQGTIDARVWESYTDTAINNYDSIVGDRFADLRIELNSITSTVGEIETKYDGEIASMTTDISEIKQTSGEISLTVESLEQEVEKNASDIAGAIAKIDMLPDSISLSVTNASLGNSAYIRLTVDEEVTSEVLLDLRDVRQAFANDKTAVTISAGTVAFESNTFLVESTYFRVTADGHIYATAGTIGGFEIGDAALFNPSTKSSFRAEGDGVYLGTDGIALGETFFVTSSGSLYATTGQFGNIHLNTSGIYSGSHSSFTSTADGFFLGPDGISIGGYVGTHLGTGWKFRVDSEGNLVCHAGVIGSWTIANNYLSSGPTYYTDATEGTYMGYDGWFQYGSNTTWTRIRDGTVFLGYNETFDTKASGYLSGWQMNLDNNTQCLRMAGRGGIFLCGPELVVYQSYPEVSGSVQGALGATETVRVLTSTSGDWRELVFVNGIFNG